MLIKPDIVRRYLTKPVKGVLHIGAHECEERSFYHWLRVPDSSIVWIDAIEAKVREAARRGIPNVYQAVVTDTDDSTVEFNVTNNVQSSSVLEFGSHAHHHPHVVFTGKQTLPTVTIDSFLKRNALDPSRYTFWNLDIQGAELMALRGGTNALQYADAVYLEVNTEEVYKGCAKLSEIDEFLGQHGFRRVLTDITQYGWGDALYIR
jgi:FkbM family methyltransferase